MAYPIKYIENNLVFNHDGECFAYYELLPYNYSFLSPEQKDVYKRQELIAIYYMQGICRWLEGKFRGGHLMQPVPADNLLALPVTPVSYTHLPPLLLPRSLTSLKCMV